VSVSRRRNAGPLQTSKLVELTQLAKLWLPRFLSIFEIAPEVYGMFRFTREFEPGSEELFQSERFKKHATGVIHTVNTAVNMLAPDLDPLIEVLHELGKKHAQYGALPAHYAVVGRALIDTLQKVLGDKFTNEVKTAWARIYDVMSTSMIEGAEEAYKDL
jgi:hemoglobin-like flavoprotein